MSIQTSLLLRRGLATMASNQGLWAMRRLVTIYHTPGCPKSNTAVDLLTNNGVSVKTVEYGRTTPAVVKDLLSQLGASDDPRRVMHHDDWAYKNLNLSAPHVTQEDLIEAINTHPTVMKGPIVTDGTRAVVGSEPESVLQLLDDLRS